MLLDSVNSTYYTPFIKHFRIGVQRLILWTLVHCIIQDSIMFQHSLIIHTLLDLIGI